MDRDRRVRQGVLGALVLTGVLGAGATVAIAAGGGCRGFRVDRDAWRQDREAVAEAIDRCGGLEGLREEQVHALLGSPRSLGTEQVWIIDSWLDILAEPHSDRFTVSFDADGRARSADVSYRVSG